MTCRRVLLRPCSFCIFFTVEIQWNIDLYRRRAHHLCPQRVTLDAGFLLYGRADVVLTSSNKHLIVVAKLFVSLACYLCCYGNRECVVNTDLR